MESKKFVFRYGECNHPFKSVTAYAISGEQDTKDAEFQIHFRCNICGESLIMLSKGHVATKDERAKVEALHGNDQTGKGSEPG
jgi:hypothetical protein